MDPEKETEVFKKGLGIKEPQGVLTVGSLDKKVSYYDITIPSASS